MQTLKLLWFEDNMAQFKSIVKVLDDHCLGLQRKLEIDKFDHYPEDFDIQMFEGAHCIAFVDLNLNNGQKGSQIIEILREKGTFIEILLYSNNPSELEKLTEGANYVEGIYRHATMSGLEEKMKSMIDQINYKEIMTLRRYGYL